MGIEVYFIKVLSNFIKLLSKLFYKGQTFKKDSFLTKMQHFNTEHLKKHYNTKLRFEEGIQLLSKIKLNIQEITNGRHPPVSTEHQQLLLELLSLEPHN